MSDFDLIIRGATVVRPGAVSKLDLGIKDGIITSMGEAVFGSTNADLDATNFHVFPGLVDPHVHFNEPGRTEWEGFDHGSRALAVGGVTSYLDMPLNATPPVVDKGSFLAKWHFGKASSFVDFGLWGGLTPGSLGNMHELTECGVIGFKAFMSSSGVDDFPMADDATLYEGMRRAFDLEQIVAVHAENDSITAHLARQAVAEGRLGVRDYLDSRPVIAELEAVQRAILFAWVTECPLHIVHVSTARAIEIIAGAKAQGVNISCETCPHYLILTEDDAERLQALAKCAPPLRSASEQAALWEKFEAGDIDMIASDHSPSPPEMKRGDDMFAVWGGITGCQSTFGLMLTEALGGHHPISMDRLGEVLSTHAARRFRLHPAKGEIAVGADADLIIVDMHADVTVREADLQYRHPSNSPYVGRQLRGKVLRTILRGETIVKDGRMQGKPAAHFLRPAENPVAPE